MGIGSAVEAKRAIAQGALLTRKIGRKQIQLSIALSPPETRFR